MNGRPLWRFAPTCAIQTVGCPIRLHRVPCHSDATWARMKQEDPVSRKGAAGADQVIRNIPQAAGNIEETACLHKSRKPLDEAEFSTADPDSRSDRQEECEGICGI